MARRSQYPPSRFLPEGHLASIRALNDLDVFLSDWLREGAAREVSYRGHARSTTAYLTQILGSQPRPCAVRDVVARTLEEDGAFHASVMRELELDTTDERKWKDLLAAAAGTMLTMFEAEPS